MVWICCRCRTKNESDYVCENCGHERCEYCDTQGDDWTIEEEDQQDADELMILLLEEEELGCDVL